MEKSLHRRIKIISWSAMPLFTLLCLIALEIVFKSTEDYYTYGTIGIIWAILMLLSFLAIMTSYSCFHQEKTWIKRLAKYMFFIYPVILVLSMIIYVKSDNVPLIVAGTIIFTFSTIFFLFYIFVFLNASSLNSTIFFIVLIIICIVLKRYHISYSGVLFTLSIILFAAGIYIYGIRCLYVIEKNPFFKYVCFLGSWLITISLVALAWKMMHWPLANLIIITSNILFILGTLIVLLKLPSSGYINWQPLYRKMLKRLILPWTFVFMLFLLRYILPELNSIIWYSDPGRIRDIVGFEMIDYDIENKNGLIE